jgi:hypothetical protein
MKPRPAPFKTFENYLTQRFYSVNALTPLQGRSALKKLTAIILLFAPVQPIAQPGLASAQSAPASPNPRT